MGTSTGNLLWDRTMIWICYEVLDVNWLTKLVRSTMVLVFSYTEFNGTEYLRMIHWLLFILSRENIWDNQQQVTFALIQSKFPNSALMEKSKSHTFMQWDQICCSPHFHMDSMWETTQNSLSAAQQQNPPYIPWLF